MTKKKELEGTRYIGVARKRVLGFIERTGRETFSYLDVNVKPGTMRRLEGNGFIVHSRLEAHRKSYCKIYMLSEREKWRIKQFDESRAGV